MALITTQRLPPGGWRYTQKNPEGQAIRSQWVNGMSSFGEFVKEVLRYRVANNLPAATAAQVAEEIDQFTCARLNDDGRFCVQKKTTVPARFFKEPVKSIQEAVARAVGKVTKLNEGRKILAEWLGEGASPVSSDIASARARVCVGCPANVSGLKPIESVAAAIQRHVESKNDLKLSTPDDANLHTCKACFCFLPLKVHVPESFIHNTPETLSELQQANPACWQLTKTSPPA